MFARFRATYHLRMTQRLNMDVHHLKNRDLPLNSSVRKRLQAQSTRPMCEIWCRWLSTLCRLKPPILACFATFHSARISTTCCSAAPRCSLSCEMWALTDWHACMSSPTESDRECNSRRFVTRCVVTYLLPFFPCCVRRPSQALEEMWTKLIVTVVVTLVRLRGALVSSFDPHANTRQLLGHYGHTEPAFMFVVGVISGFVIPWLSGSFVRWSGTFLSDFVCSRD